jgi:hypothetical protein
MLSNDDGLHGDSVEHSADAEVGVVHSDLDVALVAPLGAPTVTNDEVVLAILGAPAD